MTNLLASEPAAIIAGCGAILEAALLVAIAFGLPISADQKLTLGGLLTVVITVLTGLVTRGQVVPVAKVVTMLPEVPSVPTPPIVVETPPV